MRGRLASYNSARGFEGLDGAGLSADQIAAIQQRIAVQVAAWNKHPLGWPCAPFKHPRSVVTFVRKQLVYNGFRPAMSFTVKSPRQIQFQAIQDGITYYGVVVKTGAREIFLQVSSTHSGGDSASFATGFEA